MDEETVLYEVAEGVATITLNRPAKMNAFNDAMFRAWGAALDRAERDEAVTVVLWRGAGHRLAFHRLPAQDRHGAMGVPPRCATNRNLVDLPHGRRGCPAPHHPPARPAGRGRSRRLARRL
jgi:1,4-dihydroxy-2-naphthoyl-CoA synthase